MIRITKKRYTIVVCYRDPSVNEALDEEIVAAVGWSPIWKTNFLRRPYKRHMIFGCDEDELRDVEERLMELREESPISIEFSVRAD